MMRKRDFYKRLGITFDNRKLKGWEDDLRVVGEEDPIKPDPVRGRHLQNIYTALKGGLEKNKFRGKSKNPSIIKIFNRAAGRLNAEERRTHLEIDDSLFVLAQFRKYGEWTYPGHLSGRAAIEIYNKALTEFCTPVAKPNKHLEREVLKYLCQVRGEPEAEVMEALKDSGLFSPGFIKKWEVSHKRRK